jgi:hypothetical protein
MRRFGRFRSQNNWKVAMIELISDSRIECSRRQSVHYDPQLANPPIRRVLGPFGVRTETPTIGMEIGSWTTVK